MLNRITLIFYFFLFCQGKLGEPESTAQHRCQPPSPLVSIFSPLYLMVLFFLLLLIWVVVVVIFASTERITVQAGSVCSRASSEGLVSHVFFSALCFRPLKHAPLIFSEEDQAG